METPTMGYPGGDFRVSGADRDQVIAELSEQFQAGRLTTEELEERTGQALTAKTGRELTALLADLPHNPLSSTPGAGARLGGGGVASGGGAGGSVRGGDGGLMSGLGLAKPAIIVAAVVVIALMVSGHNFGLVALVPIVIVLFVVKGLGRRGGGGMGYDRGFERRRLHGRRRRWGSDEW